MPDLHATVTLFNALDHRFRLTLGSARRLRLTDDDLTAILDYVRLYRVWRRPTLYRQAVGRPPALPPCLLGAFDEGREVAYG